MFVQCCVLSVTMNICMLFRCYYLLPAHAHTNYWVVVVHHVIAIVDEIVDLGACLKLWVKILF